MAATSSMTKQELRAELEERKHPRARDAATNRELRDWLDEARRDAADAEEQHRANARESGIPEEHALDGVEAADLRPDAPESGSGAAPGAAEREPQEAAAAGESASQAGLAGSEPKAEIPPGAIDAPGSGSESEPAVIEGEAEEVPPTPEEAAQEALAGAELAVREPQAPLRQSFSDHERELIARLVAPGHTADELALFERICIRTGLDPFARQIYSIKRNRRREVNGQWITEQVATPQTSIDGFRLIAHRSGQYAGQTPPQWFDPDRNEWVDVWLKEGPPPAARVGVYRHGFATPLIRTVTFREFGGTNKMWKEKPALMLAKTAESQALRAAFPQELSGIYSEEEMAQAEGEHTYEAALQPIRVEPQPPGRPSSRAELFQRFARIFGDADADDCKAIAAWYVMEALQEGWDVARFAELEGGAANDAGIKIASAVMLLEEQSPDLSLSTGVRETVATAFAQRMDGIALEGPPWSLGPDEPSLPTWEMYEAGGVSPVDPDAEAIPFGDAPSGVS